MTDRRPLTEGLKPSTPVADIAKEHQFVFGQRGNGAMTHRRVPISTRMREDFAKALKRASLERQLQGVEPNTLQDILEEAIEPWLKANGLLR